MKSAKFSTKVDSSTFKKTTFCFFMLTLWYMCLSPSLINMIPSRVEISGASSVFHCSDVPKLLLCHQFDWVVFLQSLLSCINTTKSRILNSWCCLKVRFFQDIDLLPVAHFKGMLYRLVLLTFDLTDIMQSHALKLQWVKL